MRNEALFQKRQSLWLLLSLGTWFGLGKRYPFAWWGASGETLGSWFWGLLTLGLFFLAGGSRLLGRLEQKMWRTLSAPSFVSFLLACSALLLPLVDAGQGLYFKALGYPLSPSLILGTSLWSGVTLWAMRRRSFHRQHPLTFFIWVAIGGFGHRLAVTATFPLCLERSDMLLAMQLAWEQGSETGHFYDVLSTGYRLPYLPMLWASQWPVFLGFVRDGRWIGWGFFGTVLACLYWGLRSLNRASPSSSAFSQLCQLAALWCLNPYLHFRHDWHLDLFCLWILLASWAALHGRVLWTGFFSVLSLGTYQLSCFLAPFWWLAATTPLSKKQGRQQLPAIRRPWQAFKALCFLVLGSLAGLFLLLSPFLLREPTSFWEAITGHLQVFQKYRGEFCWGFAALFYHHGIASWLKGLQALSLLIGGSLGLWRWWTGRFSRQSLLWLGSCTYVSAICWHSFIENYFYLPLLLVSLFTLSPLLDLKES